MSDRCALVRVTCSIALWVAASGPAWAQNLVLNPSFEAYSSCPLGPSQLANATSWRDPYQNLVGDTCSTSDLFNSCSPFGALSVGVPANILGNQAAHTGNGYAGIIVYEGFALVGCQSLFSSGWREYLEGTLSSPLVAGETYCVSFRISLADNVKFASNDIGVYFSNTLVNVSCATIGAASNLPFTPQLDYTGPDITIVNGWQKLQWNYTATGGEQYIIIGNFKNDANTSHSCANEAAFNPYAYYYIDDVSVEPEPCCDAMFDPVVGLCPEDLPVALQPVTPGGTWSGPGITDPMAGIFDPAQAGIGAHTVLYTLDCGVDSAVIVVGSCDGLQVCLSDDGEWVASGGTGPYAWQEESTTQDCSGCLVGCLFPPGCAINVTGWSTFATGPSIPVPAGSPIRLIDAAGGELVITDPGSIVACFACPEIVVGIVASTGVACFGEATGTATVEAQGGEEPYLYQWAPGGTTGAQQEALEVGTHVVTATDINGCQGTVEVAITGPEGPVTVAIVDTGHVACFGGSTGMAVAEAQGGTAPYDYTWSPGGATGPAQDQLGVGTYMVTATDDAGCMATAQVVITGPSEALSVSVVGTTPTACGQATGSATVAASGGTPGYGYTWNGASGGATANGLGEGSHEVVVSDANGCTATLQVAIVSEPTVGSITGGSTMCSGDSVVLTASGGTSYRWSTGETTPTIVVHAGGTYTVVVTACGSDTVSTVVNETLVEASFTATPVSGEAPLEVVFANGSTPPGSPGAWVFGDGGGSVEASPSHTYVAPGSYWAVLTTTYQGCTDSDSLLIVVEEPFTGSWIEVPNVFTPNGDGTNDTWTVQSVGLIALEAVVINRWGQEVARLTGPNDAWSGRTMAGETATDGTYWYVIKAEGVDGISYDLTGSITLLR